MSVKCDGLGCSDKLRCAQHMRPPSNGEIVVWGTPKVTGELCPHFKRYVAPKDEQK